MDLLYLQEIPNASWIIEVISEKFDDAINMMTTNTVVYGGAVRDCLAGKELVGDLDILVAPGEYSILINRFVKNPKWILMTTKSQTQDSFYTQFFTSNGLMPYLTSFKTLNNRTVQVITSPSTKSSNFFQTVIQFAKQIDIVCCGVIFTNNGKAFEIIPNAYKDCKEHMLHINSTFNVVNLEKFQLRIKKLVSRGWYNDINMNQVIRNTKKQNLKLKTEKSFFKPDSQITLNEEITSIFNGAKSTVRLLNGIAKYHQIRINVRIVGKHFVTFTSKNMQTSSHIYQELMRIGIKHK